MNIPVIAASAIALWNVATFLLYGTDKYKAVKHGWRISENTLLFCAFLMGAAGALLGMTMFRHKTKHLKFKLLVPLALLVNAGVIICLVYHFVYQ